METELELALVELRKTHPRFAIESYLFLFEALEYTIAKMGKEKEQGTARHITGQELLVGIRELALQNFGALSFYVFARWGILSTEDIGEIVFALVERGLLKKRDSDRKEDFAKGFDFQEAFKKNYRVDLSAMTI